MPGRQQLIELLGNGPRRVHLVGIGGSGMSALARLLLQQGHIVTGSDISPNGETRQLQKLGAKVFAGHAARHVRPDTELLVYSSAVHADNVELKAAGELHIPCVRRAVVLSALMNHRTNIAVAGTHGKTTTTAMIAQVLSRSDSAPSFCIGAHVPALGTSAAIGGGNYFVAEADESDGTLIAFSPEYAVCLNIEPEHLDFYGSIRRLRETFEVFLASTLKTVFYCADCPVCASIAPKLRSAVSFGLSADADYHAEALERTARGSRFVCCCRDQPLGTVELNVPGTHNVLNALAAIAVADELGLPFEKIAEALAAFGGASRRFQRKHDAGGIVVVDDYAHHPTEVRATIAAARTLGGRLLVAFQPHRYTRTRALCGEFATAFAGAEKLFLTEIYPAGEKPIEGVTGRLLADAVAATGQQAVVFEADLERLAVRLLAEARPGDVILTMGAGDIGRVADALAEALRARAPNVLKTEALPMNRESDLYALLSEQSKIRRDEPMARHTSLRVGGPAQFWVEPADERDLARLLHYCHVRGIPVTVVGRGSNLLVRDGGIDGVVVSLCGEQFCRIQVDGERIIAGAGARLKAVVNAARKHELAGLEFLEGIPGSVGGALRMNAGAMGRQFFEVVEWIRYISFSGEIYDAEARNLPVTYRSCPVFANHVALSAMVRGEKAPRRVIDSRLRAFAERRWATQPAKPSAGCIFKNPGPLPAGRLIEELGLKGAGVGGARVSEVHANFIVNEGNATAEDVLRLIAMIRERARRERGIELEPEVVIVGRER